ncbi:hypothetical protein BC936DRAFT_144071 [Jimgerdemannia flammicorona]|uniref:Uncharacterized protein n=1 Tax=Jimgerdemannia flammicorona TaxID=994334 RepID=A0A433DD11_9FUNG|nr:hypothetical protein BC936DRAFT_144071 [Jimgerdemannia flammicorona]
MADQPSEIRTRMHLVLERVKVYGPSDSTRDIGRELANVVNATLPGSDENEAGGKLWEVIDIVLEHASLDTTKIDVFVYTFQHLFTNLSDQIQDSAWADGETNEIPRGANLAFKLLGMELRECVNGVDSFMPAEFRSRPGHNPVVGDDHDTATFVRWVLATDTARKKLVNVHHLIGRLWALDVMDTSHLTEMLLESYCNINSDLGTDKELEIESACALIRAAGGKGKLETKPKFDAHLGILEKLLRSSKTSFYLKAVIAVCTL